MTTPRDPDRVIRAFLAEGQTDLPDRTYEVVRSEIDQIRQRAVIGPWRVPDMNTYAKLGIAAAAVVVVAVVGFDLMPAGGGVGGGPAPTGSPSPTPTPTEAPTEAASPAAFPPDGPLDAGTHGIVVEGVPLSFDIPGPGWEVKGSISTGTYLEPDYIGIRFWDSSPENVYEDPCAHTPLSPLPEHTAASLAAAAAAIPGTDLLSGPETVDVGGRPAQHVSFTIRDDLGCDPEDAYLWYDDSTGGASGGWIWASALGSTHHVWTIDVDGKVIWIDSESFAGAGPEVEQALQGVIDSIQFE